MDEPNTAKLQITFEALRQWLLSGIHDRFNRENFSDLRIADIYLTEHDRDTNTFTVKIVSKGCPKSHEGAILPYITLG